ncbi:MAG: outer membrane beta-barrel protein [Chloroflexia bacterium]|nr:outer membrane beta-barrel protein [Chloroflexia bacterium]
MHRVNFGLRNRLDSTQNIIINGGLSYSLGNTNSNSFSESLLDASMINTLSNLNQSDKSGLLANFNGTYQKMLNQKQTVLKLSGYGSYSKSINNTNFINSLWTLDNGAQPVDNQFLDNTTDELSYSVKVGMTQKIGKYYYIEPQVHLGTSDENLDRVRGNLALSDEVISSLSPNFEKKYQWIRPGISLKRNTDKTQFNVGLQAEIGELNSKLWGEDINQTNFLYFTPRLSYEYEYKTGRRLNFFYNSSVTTPTSDQLLPVVNSINPLSAFYGNPDLKPEYAHTANLQWWIFDQFSFTSLMLSLNGSYTMDKINWKSSVDQQLIQSSTLANVTDDYQASANVDFSTPIKKLGLKVDMSIEERWNQGINYINDIENENTNLSHRFSLSFENRKKKKWDVVTGAAITLQNSWYSVQNTLNNQYFDFSWFGELRFNPNDSWNFEVVADVTNYNDLGFNKSVQVPLLSAEISYHFLKNKRGQLSLNGYDLLNQNTGIQRLNELNYLRVIQSNSIGRYVMLSFKFRLNKFGGNGNGIEVKMKR